MWLSILRTDRVFEAKDYAQIKTKTITQLRRGPDLSAQQHMALGHVTTG